MQMPWRILVLTDAGVDGVRPSPVRREGLDDWIASLEAGVDVALPAGGSRRFVFRNRADFSPARIVETLGGGVPGAAVDTVLHHPSVQRLESAWRGLDLLLEHAGAEVVVEVLSLPRKNLVTGFRETVALPEANRDEPLSLIVADYDFGNGPEDLSTLRALSEMAAGLQAPLVAGASAGFFGLRYLVQAVSLPDLVSRIQAGPQTPWVTFQASDEARWVVLTINRYLQREPYTNEAGGHAESVSESNPDSFLWGRGAWLVAAAMARSARTHGHALNLSGPQGGGFERMPVRPQAIKANVSAALATEVALSENQVLELYRTAFTPLVSPLKSTTVFLPMVVTVSRLKPGRLTLEGTLAYQLTAARLAQYCGRLLGSIPAGGAEEVRDYIRNSLAEFLGPLAQDAPDAVTVEVQEPTGAGGAVAAVRVRPRATLEGKPLDFNFMLPLQTV